MTDLSDETTARLVEAGLDPAYVLDVVTRALDKLDVSAEAFTTGALAVFDGKVE